MKRLFFERGVKTPFVHVHAMLLDDILMFVTVSEIIPGMTMPFAELMKSLRLIIYGQANNRLFDRESINRLYPIIKRKTVYARPSGGERMG